MNAVEIEQAVSELAEQPFDAAEFPYAFLMALPSIPRSLFTASNATRALKAAS